MNVTAAKQYFHPLTFLCCTVLLFFASCTIVKDYPVRQPFVYETRINIEGKYTTDEKKELTARLREQLDDSMQVRQVQKLIGLDNGPKLFYSVLQRPPVFDSVHAERSLVFMKALLNSLGYYRDSIGYDTVVRVKDDQYRTTVTFNVTPGVLFKLDSIAYVLNNDSLQTIAQPSLDSLQLLTNSALKGSLLKKGAPFAKPLLSAERDRLTDIYRNNGYLRFSNDDLRVIWDTVGIALLRPTFDPIEQAQLLEAIRKRRDNPVADIEYRLKAATDTSHLIRYHVGNVTVYPDLTVDTALYLPTFSVRNGDSVISYHQLFKNQILYENIYLKKGALYSQQNYLRTLNRFNALGAWRLVSIDQKPRPGSDTVDFVIKLTPAEKYIFDTNLEGSQNWGTVLTQGTLIGFGVSLQNRNFARGANQANTSLRIGTDLNFNQIDQIARTQQISFSHTITFPRAIPRFKFLSDELKESFQTSLGLNANYINRINFLELLTVNGSWGYRFSWKNKLLSLRFPNIEYAFINRKRELLDLIAKNQSYKYIFNDGFVSSMIGGLSISGGNKTKTNVLRLNTELSGLISGAIRSKFIDSNLYRFAKLDVDFRQTHRIRRTALAWRVFAGAGYGLPLFATDSNNRFLPFFKSYSAGGANSMRAWPLRKLGPGSTIKSFAGDVAPDRFGDVQIEVNGEYRFYVADIRGVILNSVLFTDIGNIWTIRKNNDFPGGSFQFNKLWNDLAIGAGTGLRIDFGLFLVRVDWAYKLKDPSPADPLKQNKFFPERNFLKGQLQLGVSYPF